MRTTTPTKQPNAAPLIINTLTLTALAACINLGPLIYRALHPCTRCRRQHSQGWGISPS